MDRTDSVTPTDPYDFPANQPHQTRFALHTSLRATRAFHKLKEETRRKKEQEVNSRLARKFDVHKIREVLGVP